MSSLKSTHTVNFDIGSAFSKCLGSAFSAGPGLGLLYKVCPLSHRFSWIYSAALPLPKKLTLLITSLLYLSSRWIRNHLVKVSTWLIPWVVTLRKSLTQEIRCETSPKWCAKKTKAQITQNLENVAKHLPSNGVYTVCDDKRNDFSNSRLILDQILF